MLCLAGPHVREKIFKKKQNKERWQNKKTLYNVKTEQNLKKTKKKRFLHLCGVQQDVRQIRNKSK